MKNQVHDLLAAGFSEEQVFAYFEASYGEFIRLAPKAEGFTLVVWILPALLLLLGGFIAYGYLRDRTRKPATQEAAPAARPAEDADLDPWLRRVREMSGTGES
jgi:cytochrome c-type biogenesis protein CcmH